MKRFHFYEADTGGGFGGGLLGGAIENPAGAAPAWAWAKEDGTFSDGWIEKLPAEMHSEASLKTIGSVGDLAKAFTATKKLVGTKLEAPGEGATPEQVSAWRKVVGAPEKAEGYYSDTVKSFRPDSVPETLWNAEAEKKFVAEVAHKHHLSPAVVRDILAFQGEMTAQAVGKSAEDQGAFLNGEKAALQKAWGGELDANSAMVRRVAQTVGLDADKIHEWTPAQVAVGMAKLGKLFSEDKLVKGDNAGIAGTVTDRIRDITDSKSQSVPAREYRGEFGGERQAAIQSQLHELYAAQKAK